MLDIAKFDFRASDIEGFKNTIICIFNKHGPIKRKYICANEAIKLNELWPYYQKHENQIILNRTTL